MRSQWDFYSKISICIPLPVTRIFFAGQHYAFSVMIVFNFILFMFIAIGQISIYLSVKVNIMTTDTTRKAQDMIIARRLITVVVSDFLCWFPIGLLGLLAAAGTPVSSEVNVALAIFVLPLNSALNPFLYTLNLLLETQRKAQELSLLKFLEDQITSAKSLSKDERQPLSACRATNEIDPTLSDVVHFLSSCLASGKITPEELKASLCNYNRNSDNASHLGASVEQ